MILSIVIPVFNSEHTLYHLVERLYTVLSNQNIEVVLVNDGSKDASEAICLRLVKKFDNVKLISLRRNFGEFNAVMCGLNHISGDYCVIIDDDDQNPPEEILKLLNKAQEGDYDVVYSDYGDKKHSIIRNIGSNLVNWMTTWLLDKPKGLYLSSFKILKAEIVQEIIQYKGPHPYLDALILRITRHIGTIHVEHSERANGRSNYSWVKLISLFMTILFGFSIRPLRLLTIMGFGLMLCSVGLIIGEVFYSLMTLHIPHTDHVIWLSFLILTSFQFFGMGMLGEYLGKMFMSQTGMPQYSIRFIKQRDDRQTA